LRLGRDVSELQKVNSIGLLPMCAIKKASADVIRRPALSRNLRAILNT